MKLLTRHTDYSVNALAYIAREKRSVTVTELCEQLDMPRAFLRGILQTLTNHGMVRSAKGRNGGFRLALSPKRIRVLDIMGVFQDVAGEDECLFRKAPCPRRRTCVLRRELSTIRKSMNKVFGAMTIASLIKGRA